MIVVVVERMPTLAPKMPRLTTAQRPTNVRFCGTRSESCHATALGMM
jgi:hypothetical protein